MTKIRVGFCSLWDARDPNQYSGYASSIYHALRAQDADLVDIFPLPQQPRAVDWARKLAAKAGGRFHHWDREPVLLDRLARVIERRCRETKVDLLLAPSSIPLTRVDLGIPKVFTTDQVFPSLLGTYVKAPSARYRQLGLEQERAALAGATAAVFPSAWAIEEAVARCGGDPAKLHLIPWGANLPREPDESEVERLIERRQARNGALRLLFVGREWARKGGELVLATLAELDRRRVPAVLTIVGAVPPGSLPPNVTVLSFLDKTTPEGARRFGEIMAESQLLFVPSRAEAYGQVFCEAAAYGMPVLSTAVGGIPSIVEEGVTGFLLPSDATAPAYADCIQAIIDLPDLAVVARAARRRYRERLNWHVFAARLNDLLSDCAARRHL